MARPPRPRALEYIYYIQHILQLLGETAFKQNIKYQNNWTNPYDFSQYTGFQWKSQCK